jgi:hypothetical protein
VAPTYEQATKPTEAAPSTAPSSTESAQSSSESTAPAASGHSTDETRESIGSGTDATGAAKHADSDGAPAGVLGQTEGDLSQAKTTQLRHKVEGQQAALEGLESHGSEPLLACQGVGYGGCSLEEQTSSPTGHKTTGATPSSEGQDPEGAPNGGTKATEELTQSQRELLELAGGARIGPADNASLIPSLVTTGLSEDQRVQVASMVGNVVEFDIRTEGWSGKRLWLTWTMYEKREGYWNPSDHVYLINHAEAYVVPEASDDEGVLTFWFPIPREHGDYRVHYLIRAPGNGHPLKAGQTPSFRS